MYKILKYYFCVLFTTYKFENLLKKRPKLPQGKVLDTEYFIYCLEAVNDIDTYEITETQKKLEELAIQYGIASIHTVADSYVILSIDTRDIINI